MEYFCPYCFANVESGDVLCPSCGRDIHAWEETRPYVARLVQALKHPIDEVRMGTIITLGNQADPQTAAAMVECAYRFPTMMTQNLEIIRALQRFPVCLERDIALELIGQHPSQPVAQRARDLLADPGYQRAPAPASPASE